MVEINNDICLRCGMCTSISPEIFEFDDEGNIKVNNDKIDENNKKEVDEAKDSCPVSAISEK